MAVVSLITGLENHLALLSMMMTLTAPHSPQLARWLTLSMTVDRLSPHCQTSQAFFLR